MLSAKFKRLATATTRALIRVYLALLAICVFIGYYPCQRIYLFSSMMFTITVYHGTTTTKCRANSKFHSLQIMLLPKIKLSNCCIEPFKRSTFQKSNTHHFPIVHNTKEEDVWLDRNECYNDFPQK